MRALIATGGVVAILVIAWFATADDRGEALPQMSVAERIAYLQEEIRRDGGVQTYDALADNIQDLDFGAQHVWAHAFGAALYAIEGIDGIGVCDDRFVFGCFHQFLGDAIHERGIESIASLNDKCFGILVTTPLSCQHGIGHGVLSYEGYDDVALMRALKVCETLRGNDAIGGCYGGVFMEYNIRTMLLDKAEPRAYTGNPFVPCDALNDPFIRPCIYWQPQWWTQTVVRTTPPQDAFRTMGEYCRAFSSDVALRRTCIEGIGNVVIREANYDADMVRELCDAAGETVAEKVRCRSVGANHFGLQDDMKQALQVCDDLSGNERVYCLTYAHNKQNTMRESIENL